MVSHESKQLEKCLVGLRLQVSVWKPESRTRPALPGGLFWGRTGERSPAGLPVESGLLSFSPRTLTGDAQGGAGGTVRLSGEGTGEQEG